MLIRQVETDWEDVAGVLDEYNDSVESRAATVEQQCLSGGGIVFTTLQRKFDHDSTYDRRVGVVQWTCRRRNWERSHRNRWRKSFPFSLQSISPPQSTGCNKKSEILIGIYNRNSTRLQGAARHNCHLQQRRRRRLVTRLGTLLNVSISVISSTLHFCVLVLWVWRLFFLCFYFILFYLFIFIIPARLLVLYFSLVAPAICYLFFLYVVLYVFLANKWWW